MRKTCLGPQPQITDQGLCWWVEWRRLHHVKWSFHTRAAAAAAESCLICARTCTEILYVPENPVGWNGWLSVNERKASIDFKMVKLFSLGNTEDKANLFDGQYSCSGGLWENGSSTETVASRHLSGKDGGSRESLKMELFFLNDSPKPREPFQSKPICKWWLLLVLTMRPAEMLLHIQA